jgi:hypothetical protein
MGNIREPVFSLGFIAHVNFTSYNLEKNSVFNF